jgi:hypothetical protein
MTAKHNSKHARNNLWVAKHRAATAKSDPSKKDHDARQHTLLAKTKATRAMSALLASLNDTKPAEEEKEESAASTQAEAPEKKGSDGPSKSP